MLLRNEMEKQFGVNSALFFGLVFHNDVEWCVILYRTGHDRDWLPVQDHVLGGSNGKKAHSSEEFMWYQCVSLYFLIQSCVHLVASLVVSQMNPILGLSKYSHSEATLSFYRPHFSYRLLHCLECRCQHRQNGCMLIAGGSKNRVKPRNHRKLLFLYYHYHVRILPVRPASELVFLSVARELKWV